MNKLKQKVENNYRKEDYKLVLALTEELLIRQQMSEYNPFMTGQEVSINYSRIKQLESKLATLRKAKKRGE